MTTTVFVNNLPKTITETQLRNWLLPAGQVKDIDLIQDRVTGQQKNYAFVQFVDEHNALCAIRSLHNTDLEGRRIELSLRRPDPPRTSTIGSRIGIGLPAKPTNPFQQMNLFVDRLSFKNQHDVVSDFKSFLQRDPVGAREFLITYPEMAHVLLNMNVRMGTISEPTAAILTTFPHPLPPPPIPMVLPSSSTPESRHLAPPPPLVVSPFSASHPPIPMLFPISSPAESTAKGLLESLTEREKSLLQRVSKMSAQEIALLPLEMQNKVKQLQTQFYGLRF